MYKIDWNKVREQIVEMSELIDEDYDVEIVEDTVFRNYTKTYTFSGNIDVCGEPVYTSGTYMNDLDSLEVTDFTSDCEDLELYLEEYTLEEIEELISTH